MGSINPGGAIGPKPRSVQASAVGVVATIPTGLKPPITVTRDSGSTAITFAASGNRITVSIATALAVGASLKAIARAVQADGAGVLIPVTLTGVAVAPTPSPAPTPTPSPTPTPTPDYGPSVTIGDAQNYIKAGSPYLAYNSPWGKGSLTRPADYADDTTIYPNVFPAQTRMDWRWPEAAHTQPYGINFVAWGNYNYAAVSAPIPSRAVSEIAELTQSFAYSYTGQDFNTLTEFYLTTVAGDSSTKVAEIGWFLHTPAATIAFLNASTSWGVYTDDQGRKWNCRRSASGDAGNFIMFVPPDGSDILAGIIDAKHLLDWLVSQGRINSAWFFNGWGFGSEPLRSSGSLTITQLSHTYAGIAVAPAPTLNFSEPANSGLLTLVSEDF